MKRHTLDGVEAFLRVAERRSFTAAAYDLGVTPSAISQTIRALEQRTGVPLLTRSTRSVGLTQAGEQFLASAAPAMRGLEEAFDLARNFGERPVGRLRINLMRAAVRPMFEPILAGFCTAYPDIELEICADDSLVDLTAGGFDAGVRLGESLAADMVAVRLRGPLRFVVVGTPDYLDRNGRPKSIADLKSHQCVRLRMPSGAILPWGFIDSGRDVDIAVTGQVIANDYGATLLAVEQGVGLGMFAESLTATAVEAGKLEIVLEDYARSSGGLFLYYPERRQVMPKLRVFIDYLIAHLHTHERG